MQKSGGILVLALATLLFMTGKFLLAAPLLIFGLWLIGRNTFGVRLTSAKPSPATVKRFRTTLLDVEIDQATGAIQGRVVAGRFARRTLGALSAHEATALWREARIKDPQCVPIIEAMLDRIDPRWRELQGAHAQGDADAKGQITPKEAYNVLGLSTDATRADVQRAHKELMKRFHPDQGGSNYLAAKINEAKDILLARIPE